MKFFQDYTMHWWEFGLLKTSLLAFGILIGANWPVLFSGKLISILLWVIFAVPSIYLIIISMKQAAKKS